MTLYDRLNNVIDIEHFHNDTMLYVGGHKSWAEAFDKYNLSPSEEVEQASSITFWQDQYDLAPTQQEKDIVFLQMDRDLRIAYLGCDREAIDEATFLQLIGTTPTVASIKRRMAFLADRVPPPPTNGGSDG